MTAWDREREFWGSQEEHSQSKDSEDSSWSPVGEYRVDTLWDQDSIQDKQSTHYSEEDFECDSIAYEVTAEDNKVTPYGSHDIGEYASITKKMLSDDEDTNDSKGSCNNLVQTISVRRLRRRSSTLFNWMTKMM